MASRLQQSQHPGVHVEERTSSKGVVTYRLKWYVMGVGQQSLTLRTSKLGARDVARTISQQGADMTAADYLASTQPEAPEPVRTFGQVAALAIADKVNVKPETRDRYQQEVDNDERLGQWRDRNVRSMTADEVKGWVRRLQGDGLAGSTIDERMKVLRMAIGYAHRKGWVDSNWMREVPRVGGKPLHNAQQRAEMHVLTPLQVRALCDESPVQWASLWLLLAKSGLRISEALGLQVRDVDMTAGKVHVRQQAGRGGVKAPKSSHSVRTVPLDAEVLDALRPFVVGAEPNAFVWHNWAGKPYAHRTAWQQFKNAAARAGLRDGQRPHDLRHTYATWLLMARVPVHVVSRYLGHADASITQRVYAHVMPEGEQMARDALAAISVSGQPTPLTARRRTRTA